MGSSLRFRCESCDHELVFFTNIGLRGSILRPETGADYEQENEFLHGARRPLLGSDFLVTRPAFLQCMDDALPARSGRWRVHLRPRLALCSRPAQAMALSRRG